MLSPGHVRHCTNGADAFFDCCKGPRCGRDESRRPEESRAGCCRRSGPGPPGVTRARWRRAVFVSCGEQEMYRRLDSLRYRGRGRIFINESSQIKEPTTDEPQTAQSAVPENDARKTMLARIREHLAASAPFDKVHHEQHETGATPTAGRAVSQPANSDPVDRFRAALESVNGNCIVVPDEAAAAASLKQ